MELELQLLDPVGLDWVNGIVPLMVTYPDQPFVKPEYNQATVEINSRVCSTIGELEADATATLTTLHAKCRKLGTTLCGGGTHPFGQQRAVITPMPRYLERAATSGYLSNFVTFALHVHVGMPSGDEAVRIMGRLKPYLPLLLALSANSPFWRGEDTGHASFRQRLLASKRSYGIPPVFQSWQNFSEFFQAARQSGTFATIRDIHWDLRLQPNFGTLEVRVMDSPSTLQEALMLAAFIHSLTVYLKHCEPEDKTGLLLPLQEGWIERENYFRASHLGLDARYIDNDRGHERPFRAALESVIEAVEPTAAELGETAYLQLLVRHMEKGTGYQRQRRIFRETGSLKAVVAFLESELRQGICRETSESEAHSRNDRNAAMAGEMAAL
jgi:carboxylate-amine ligase